MVAGRSGTLGQKSGFGFLRVGQPMSHPRCYSGSIMKPAANKKISAPVQLTWSHYGVLYRATAWPDVVFEAQRDGQWIPFAPNPSSEVFAAAAVMLSRPEWNRYLEFVPAAERSFLQKFSWNRLAALAVLVECPGLLSDLADVPALTMFVAMHVSLRGGSQPCWAEIRALHERMGLYGLCEWLGLPANRRTLEALATVEDATLAKRVLEPLREALWNGFSPERIRQYNTRDRELAPVRHVLAA
jgi:hypothetical protein